MCSMRGDRLAEIGQAIDQLAADYPAALRDGQDDDVAGRLARIWLMISDLDPELARRLPGYGLPT